MIRRGSLRGDAKIGDLVIPRTEGVVGGKSVGGTVSTIQSAEQRVSLDENNYVLLIFFNLFLSSLTQKNITFRKKKEDDKMFFDEHELVPVASGGLNDDTDAELETKQRNLKNFFQRTTRS